MMNNYNNTTFYKINLQKAIQQLSSFIRIPSVSAEPKHKKDVADCANWLANHLKQVGLEHIKVIPTKKHPLVYADWIHAPGKATLLIYGHYDVQPVDPVNEWNDNPFSGFVKGNYIFGRGSSDDKGQLFVHIKALQYYLETFHKLPINIKCIFEGEEEIGSENLLRFLDTNSSLLRSDVAVVSDMRILSPVQPAITYSLRGMLSVELEVKGQDHDLHSGNFGGAVCNPLEALCQIISKLHNRNGKITIPGFYDNVLRRGYIERDYMQSRGPSDNAILCDAGAEYPCGESGYSLYERISIRPSLSINGITGGYQGEGPKAIIHSKASAKLSFRLVPNQNPEKIYELFKNFIHLNTPKAVKSSVKKVGSAHSVLSDINNKYIELASLAYKKAFRKQPLFLASGGTIPIVAALRQKLGIPVVLMGFALPDDNLHAPNERFYIPNFHKGINTSMEFIRLISLEQLVNVNSNQYS